MDVGSYETLRENGLNFAKLLSDPEESKDPTNSEVAASTKHLRQNSESSLNSATESIFEYPMPVVEIQQTGSLELSLYKKYFAAGGGPFLLTFFVVSCVFAQVLASTGDSFLSYWVNTEAPAESLSEDAIDTEESIMSSILNIFRDAGDPNKDNIDIYIFTGITILTIAVTLSRSFLLFNVAMRSSTNLHNSMFKGISHASMHFFNTNPTGRILNRFSKDMGQVDELLPTVMVSVITTFLSMFGILAVVGMVNPLFLVPTVFLSVIFYFLRGFYLKTSMDLKRIEGISNIF